MEQSRLDKLVSKVAGVSRQEAKRLITSGQVQVDGALCKEVSTKVAQGVGLIIAGTAVQHVPNVYIMMNKPKGLLCVSKDANRQTVVDIVREKYPKRNLFPAGRLDKDSEGFVLITDDGLFAHEILSPKRHVAKTYLVTLDVPFTQEMAAGFQAGVILADGTKALSAKAEFTQDPYVCEVVLFEGMYHQIKRMFGQFDAGVNRLVRMKIGELMLDNTLAAGQYREIAEEELRKITVGTS